MHLMEDPAMKKMGIAALLSLLVSSYTFAQTANATLGGTVSDPTGASSLLFSPCCLLHCGTTLLQTIGPALQRRLLTRVNPAHPDPTIFCRHHAHLAAAPPAGCPLTRSAGLP